MESFPGEGAGRTPGRGRSKTRQGRTVGGGDTESAWEVTTVAFEKIPRLCEEGGGLEGSGCRQVTLAGEELGVNEG